MIVRIYSVEKRINGDCHGARHTFLSILFVALVAKIALEGVPHLEELLEGAQSQSHALVAVLEVGPTYGDKKRNGLSSELADE